MNRHQANRASPSPGYFFLAGSIFHASPFVHFGIPGQPWELRSGHSGSIFPAGQPSALSYAPQIMGLAFKAVLEMATIMAACDGRRHGPRGNQIRVSPPFGRQNHTAAIRQEEELSSRPGMLVASNVVFKDHRCDQRTSRG